MTALRELTVAELGGMILRLEERFALQAEQHAQTMAVVQVLLARVTDKSHVSRREAASILSQRWHRNVSSSTVGRMLERGLLTMERIPGTKHQGIPTEQLTAVESSYVPARAARTARERQRKGGSGGSMAS